LGVHHDVVVLEGHRGVLCGFHTRLLGAALSGPANVEGPHGQLRSRLTDGLGGDDADRLTNIDRGTAGQVTAVALAADASAGFTGQGGANTDAAQRGPLHALDLVLLGHLVALDDDFAPERIDIVLGSNSAQYALAQRRHDFDTIDHRAHRQTTLAATILLDDDGVLGHVDEAAG